MTETDPVHDGYSHIPGPEPLSEDERAIFDAEMADPETRLGHPGGKWVLSAPDRVESIWGNGKEVGWSKGEALILVGGDGSGKTALNFNLIIRQIGLTTEPLLGMTVVPRHRILYLAQDRPTQARRAFKRMVGAVDADTLDTALSVIDWPIGLVDDNPELLVELAQRHEADTVYVDSLKDIARAPSTEESGLAIKRSYALCVAEGIQICMNHHDRKTGQDSNRKILKLADVYGSRFITAGAGSVIALNGGSGDPIIDLRHLKQPDEEVGPLRVSLDFSTGGMSILEATDIVTVARQSPGGLTAMDAARVLYETDAPSRSDKERARRKLVSLADRGLIDHMPGNGSNQPDRWGGNKVHDQVHAGLFG